MAVMDACSQLRDRLAPFRHKGDAEGKQPSFAEAVQAAYQAMVDLSARGFHAITHITGQRLVGRMHVTIDESVSMRHILPLRCKLMVLPVAEEVSCLPRKSAANTLRALPDRFHQIMVFPLHAFASWLSSSC